MGLDGVELLMAFEEAFGLEISDAEAERMLAPRDVVDFVYRARGLETKKIYLSRRAFYQVRRRLLDAGHSRAEIRLETRLEDIFPRKGRRRKWPLVRGDFTTQQWPDLVRPKWLTRVLLVAVVISAAYAGFSFAALSDGAGLAFIFAIPIGIFAAWMTRGLAAEFPGLATIGDLAVSVSCGTNALLSSDEELDRASISRIVKEIVIEQLGMSALDYGEDKHFVRDFGI